MKKNRPFYFSSPNLFFLALGLIFHALSLVTNSLISSAMAYELNVESVEFGGCWIGEEEGQVKLSLFDEGKSLGLGKKDFEQIPQAISTYLEKNQNAGFIGIGAGVDEENSHEWVAYLYCRPTQSHMAVTMVKNQISICAHLSLGKKPEIIAVYPNHERSGKSPCEGQALGKLLVKTDTDKVEKKACEEEIQKTYEQDLESWAFGKNFMSLKFKPSFYFREKEIKEQILALPTCQDILASKDIEYDDLRLPPGNYFPLWPSSLRKGF